MLTLLVVLGVRLLVLVAVVALLVGVGVLVRRRLRRTGRWHQVQEVVRANVVSRPGATPPSGVRSAATGMLQHWIDDGTKR